MNNQRILIITRNLPPLVGGMERLNWHMADELSKYAEVKIIAPKGSAALKPENVTITECPLKPLPLFMLVALCKAVWLAFAYKPTTVLAGSGLTAPLAWLASKLAGAKSAAYLHGLDITVQSKPYQKIWVPFFKRLDHIIVNSTPTKQLALNAGVQEEKIGIVYPGVEIPNAPQPNEAIQAFKQKHQLEDKKILLSVGRLTTRKGLKEFVENALPNIVKKVPNALLLVVGEAPKNSLGAGIQTQEEILKAAQDKNIENHIKFIGVITDKTELACAYESADIHVFPVRHIPDDPEGFGMVAIEAAAHGLPTVAFATGGIVDAVKEGVSGYLVEKDNYQSLSEKVVETIQIPIEKNGIKDFAKGFTWGSFGKRIHSIVNADRRSLERKAHATLNLPSRALKAKKIEILMNLKPSTAPLRVLEVGCGSGGISHYFGTHETLNCDVTAVDVYDNRLTHEGYTFKKVTGVALPFKDNSFDLVITNHVIEHVGELSQQLTHLKEIQRVLAPTGQAYLAVPNRWMLTEPHYNLKFLSWWPKRWRSKYLQLWKKGDFYDCEPFSLAALEKLLDKTQLSYTNLSVEATRVTLELEKPNSLITKLLTKTPTKALCLFKPIIPTLIYKLESTNNEQ